MSIVNNDVASNRMNDMDAAQAAATSSSDESRRRNNTQAPDPSELREQGQLFRSLMNGPLTARQLAEWAAQTADAESEAETGGADTGKGLWDADAGTGAGADGVDPWAPDTWNSDPSGSTHQPSGDSRETRQHLADLSRQSPMDISAMLQARHVIDAGPGLQSAAPATAPDPSLAELIEKHVRRVLASADARDSTDGEMRIELSDAVFPGTALSLKRTSDGWQLTATSDNRRSLEKLNQFAPALVERFAQASLGRLTLVSSQ